MRAHLFLSVAVLVLATTGAASCFDPVRDDALAALPPEVPGVPEGPLHRAGQPCLTCHGGKGPGSPEWSIAGTVYAVRGMPAPLENVSVVVTDSSDPPRSVELRSNEVGNFYIEKDAYAPTFPVFVELRYPGIPAPKVMMTRIGRNGGCNSCHFGDDRDSTHMPPVFMRDR